MSNTILEPKPKGITSILNDHYNSNISNFDKDIESENLKTVMLKIGEIPGSINFEKDNHDTITQKINDYYKGLPRIKKLKLDPEIYKKNKFTTKDKRNLIEKCTIDFEQYYNLVSEKNKELWQNEDQWNKYKMLPTNIKGEILEGLRKFDYSQIEGMPEDFETNIKKLGDLNKYFENYGKCRRFILKCIYESWCDEKGEYCKSSEDLRSLVGISEITHGKVKEIEKNDNKDKLNTKQIQEITNAFHDFVKKFYEKNTEVKEFVRDHKMSRLLPNMYEDISGGLVGFFRKLVRAECQFENIFDSNNKVGKFGNIVNSYNKNIFVRQKLNEALSDKNLRVMKPDDKKNAKELQVLISQITSLKPSENKLFIIQNISTYNSKRNSIIELWEVASRYKQSIENGGFIISQETRDYIKEVIENYFEWVFFDPKRTFPNFDDDKNKWTSIIQKINDTIQKINDTPKTTEELTIKYVAGIFRGSFDREPTEEEKLIVNIMGNKIWKSPSAQVKEILFDAYTQKNNKKLVWKWKKEEIIDLASKSIKKFETEIINQDGTKKYRLLKEYAGWIYILLKIQIVEVNDPQSKADLLKEISQLASTISGFAYNLERDGFENQSIYLSDFLTPPTSEESDFKSSAYLATAQKSNSLNLALSFGKSILRDDMSTNKALVYTFESKNDEISKYSEIWQNDKQSDLKFFDYDYWNTKEPLAYKSFTKPNTDIGIGESEFNFPLHFGVNQSRKYFWNTVRGTENKVDKTVDKNNQIHHIFNPNSRLKVSSMRLIRKHNPIRGIWEYYLSLAIYRLEKIIDVKIDMTNNTIGFDVGDNNLLAYSKVDKQGKDLGSKSIEQNPHTTGHQTLVSKDKLDEISKMMKQNNFIPAKTRKKINNKTESIARQVSGMVTKMVIGGNYVDFEADYKGDKNYKSSKSVTIQVSKKLQKSIVPKTGSKLLAELPSNQTLNPKNPSIKYSDLLGIVPTELTSLICSNCGYCHVKNEKITENTLKEKIDITKLKQHLFNITEKGEIDIRDFIIKKDENQVALKPDDLKYFVVETNWENNYYNKTSFKDSISTWKISLHTNQNTEIPKDILNIFSCRPTFRPDGEVGNVEKFRCINCNFVTECDYQAGLNIARWRVYLHEHNYNNYKFDDKSENTKKKDHYLAWYKTQIQNNWEVPNPNNATINQVQNDIFSTETPKKPKTNVHYLRSQKRSNRA